MRKNMALDIIRLLLYLVLLSFAVNNLYISIQSIFHHHENGLWEAIWMLITDNLLVVIGVFVILALVIAIEVYTQKSKIKKNLNKKKERK